MKHQEAYGVFISKEKYLELLNKIEEDKFIYSNYQKCYEIYNNNVYIGDILFYDYYN